MMKIGLVWFRNDLRLYDNPALHQGIQENDTVIPLYIFEENASLSQYDRAGEAQKWWLVNSLKALSENLHRLGSNLSLEEGDSLKIILSYCTQHDIHDVYWNTVYEPFAITRDQHIKQALLENGIKVHTFNASLLAHPQNIHNKSGTYFKVFTPYWRHCLTQIQPRKLYPTPKKISSPPQAHNQNTELLSSMLSALPNWSRKFSNEWSVGEEHAQKKWELFIDEKIIHYPTSRDFPFIKATSELSPHLHFGEISVHQIYQELNHSIANKNIPYSSLEKFLSEIGWREFSYYLLYHFPHLPYQNFNPKFKHFSWKKSDTLLKKWQTGKTGYPIVDAGMKELWETGTMHNRVRMITASFLIKDLLIDWREGEKWFWNTLLDADMANNSASWQWVAGSGADAAPFFRIFNPILQGEKFDAQGEYIKKWLPELKNLPNKFIHAPWSAPESILKMANVILGKNYPYPIVDHAEARKKALKNYLAL